MAQLESKQVLATAVSVFTEGNYKTKTIKIYPTSWGASSPPKKMIVITPLENGTYPVLLFLPGTSLTNFSYSDLLQHISSHGFIVVAPQVFRYAV